MTGADRGKFRAGVTIRGDLPDVPAHHPLMIYFTQCLIEDLVASFSQWFI